MVKTFTFAIISFLGLSLVNPAFAIEMKQMPADEADSMPAQVKTFDGMNTQTVESMNSRIEMAGAAPVTQEAVVADFESVQSVFADTIFPVIPDDEMAAFLSDVQVIEPPAVESVFAETIFPIIPEDEMDDILSSVEDTGIDPTQEVFEPSITSVSIGGLVIEPDKDGDADIDDADYYLFLDTTEEELAIDSSDFSFAGNEDGELDYLRNLQQMFETSLGYYRYTDADDSLPTHYTGDREDRIREAIRLQIIRVMIRLGLLA